MKNVLVSLAALLLSFAGFAQCTSCTISITGNDAADHVVSIGQVLCVQPTGHLTGRIYITSGGTVCNQGHINSRDIAISGGGEFDNYGTAHADTLYIWGGSSVLHNADSLDFDLWGASSGPSITNDGLISCTSFWDTAATFVNNGTFSANTDIYLGTNSTFTNNQVFVIGRDFNNGTGSTFTTSCMVPVQRNWYNSGTINGTTGSCSGFNISGQSYNSGTVGAVGQIDLCDAGHPTGGIDGNSGTMTGVTYCQCQNVCTTMVGIKESVDKSMAFKLYPNPATDRLEVQFTEEAEATITLQNTLGQEMQRRALPKGTKEMSLNLSSFSNGLYTLTVESAGGRTSRKIEILK